jgi:integrase
MLGMCTGQRRGGMIALDWSAYDGATLRVRQQKSRDKTRPALVIPVHPVLKADLDAWKRKATSTRILTQANGRPWPGSA